MDDITRKGMYLIVDIMIRAFTNFILLIWFVKTTACKIMEVFYFDHII